MKNLFLTLSVCSIMSCQSQNTATAGDTSAGTGLKAGTYTMKEGETKKLSDGSSIQFIKVLEDSRCPKGVNCIWEGTAVLDFTAKDKTGASQSFQISTVDRAAQYRRSVKWNASTITLIEVQPYPDQTKNFKQNSGNYTATISVIPSGLATDTTAMEK